MLPCDLRVIKVLNRLKTLKWLRLVGILPLCIPTLYLSFVDETARRLGIFAFCVGAFVGIFGGFNFNAIVGRVFNAPRKIMGRIATATSAFGFWFLSVLVGTYTNANMGTGIKMQSIEVHFPWACFGSVGFFAVSPPQS